MVEGRFLDGRKMLNILSRKLSSGIGCGDQWESHITEMRRIARAWHFTGSLSNSKSMGVTWSRGD